MAEHGHSTLSVRDLVAAGYARATIRRWVAYGLLEEAGRGELRMPGSGRTREQALRLRLNRAGPGARLAGGLLLGLHGIEGFTHVRGDHIAVPADRRARVEFPVVRTPLPPADWDWIAGLPAVTVTRGLIGAAATYHRARVRAGYDDAKRKGLTDAGLVAERLDALGNVHGAPQMRPLVRSGALQMESEGERDLLGIFRPGDPLPQPQVWVCWRGRYYRLDFAYLDAALDLEYDGGHHARRRHEDADRNLALAELGDPERVGHERDAARSRGHAPADPRRPPAASGAGGPADRAQLAAVGG